MRQLTTILLLTLIYSCKDSNHHGRKTVFDNNLLIGEWRLDSSSNRFFSYDRLVILEDSSFYLFSGSDGGSLITKGKRFGQDSVSTDFYGNVELHLIDSNYFHLSGGWTNIENFYKRTNYKDYHDNLKQYLQQDSLRRKAIGWWKLISSKSPVQLVNYYGYYNKFTLNIRHDGKAIFYLENKLDSMVEYSYFVYLDGIDFFRGDMGSDCKTSFDNNGNMKLVLDSKIGDTLLLTRLADLK